MQARQAVLLSRKILESVTPLHFDCGTLCRAQCCQPLEGDEISGMLLFPGEENFYSTSADWYRLVPSHLPGITLFVCTGTCPREERPLACRIFPLLPIIRKDGSSGFRMDMRGHGLCPLCSQGRSALSPDFIHAVSECSGILAQSEEIRAFILTIQKEEKAIRDLLKSLNRPVS